MRTGKCVGLSYTKGTCIDLPKAGRGHATLVHPVEGEMLAFTKFKSKCLSKVRKWIDSSFP